MVRSTGLEPARVTPLPPQGSFKLFVDGLFCLCTRSVAVRVHHCRQSCPDWDEKRLGQEESRLMQRKTRKIILTPGGGPQAAPKRRVTNHVYFLRCQDFIKIGTATCARSRHRAVQTVSPFEVELLCAIPGNADLERSLHRRFWHLRERGEWFRPDASLEAYIARSLEKTKAANIAAWSEVAKCDECGHDTRCMTRRADVEAAVIPLQLAREPGCIQCALDQANTYKARGVEMYYASLHLSSLPTCPS